MQGFSGSVSEILIPYLLKEPRIVQEGQDFEICHNGLKVQFRVMETEPNTACVITRETNIHCEGQPIKRA